MKNLFNRILSLLCAVTLLICALSACAAAEEDAATPTDLQEGNITGEQSQDIPEDNQEEKEPDPEQAEEQNEEPGEEEESPDESSDSPVESVEIIITRTMQLGESWEGITRDTRLVVLKLDIDKAQTVHMIVEGKNAWANVQKSDRTEENLRKVLTDPETKRAIITWEAEQGSYLITIGPEEPNIMAKARVTFLDDEAYTVWEEELEEESEETETVAAEETIGEITEDNEDSTEEKTTETEFIEEEKEGEQTDSELQMPEKQYPDTDPSRSVDVELYWDVNYPIIGDTAHLKAILNGYDGLSYTVQWQNSVDRTLWSDVLGANDTKLDVVIDEQNNHLFWRLVVYLEKLSDE